MATVGIGVGFDYDNIQDAIDNATSGETITVAAGTYDETVTLKSGITITGAGEGEIGRAHV